MKITSPAFDHNQPIPEKYTCDGANINPALSISELPPGTASLALIVDDPDAPVGRWIHWLLWNINPQNSEITEDSTPKNSIEGTTSFKNTKYGGPCPPSGTHRYFFKVYALDTTIALNSTATVKDLESAMKTHIIGQAELIGLYSRLKSVSQF